VICAVRPRLREDPLPAHDAPRNAHQRLEHGALPRREISARRGDGGGERHGRGWHVLLGYTMSAWRGLLDSPSYLARIARGLPVAALYLVVATAIGFVAFRRRDVAAG
jgi:hypothetical protein